MKKQQTKKIWLIIGVITTTIIIAGGIMMFKWRSEEEIRNWKYETSLVEALKNTYAGIEKIEMSGPIYSDPPGSWSIGVKLVFEDGEKSVYRLGHSLGYSENASAIGNDGDIKTLQRHYGTTETKVSVTYSDGKKGVE